MSDIGGLAGGSIRQQDRRLGVTNRTTQTTNRRITSSGDLLGGVTPNSFGPAGAYDMRHAPEHQVVDWVRRKYPYLAAFMDSNPEVRAALIRGAREGWGEQELYGALTGTRWWQSTSAANREWQRLVAEDPAEASRLAQQTAASMTNRARTLGLTMSSSQIASLATTATANGWTDDQTIDALIRNVNWGTLEGGELTAFRDNVKAIGAQYLVAVSDQTAQNYAMRIASGELTTAGVASIMQRQARARFSWMADLIDQGVTPADYFAPARDILARTLEVGPETIDLMDPKYLRVLEVDDGNGGLRGATLNEAMLAARRMPEWQNTANAQEQAAGVATMLGEVFGRRGI